MAYNETMRLRRVTRNGGRVVLNIPGRWEGAKMIHAPRYRTDSKPWLLTGSMMRFDPRHLRVEYRPDDAGGRSCTWCGQWTRRGCEPLNARSLAQCSADDCSRLLENRRAGA